MSPLRLQVVPSDPAALSRKDFVSDQDVKWCPGCIDYAILAQVQKTLPSLGIPREKFVFVSGIGCSSRFPYYVDTYGMHSIHGRAPAIATGIKAANPELSVWVVTGDGDALSIGGNHLMHALRRNVGLKILLFNNRIYGLTKGQYSPTSEIGKHTKSSPDGSIDYPVDPIEVALGSGATFVARALGSDGPHLQEVLTRAAAHRGCAFVEIYQNCVIFNDGAFDALMEHKDDRRLYVHHGEPLRFGKDGTRGIVLDGNGTPKVVDVATAGTAALLTHDERSPVLPHVLASLGGEALPTAFGVFRAVERAAYEEMLTAQVTEARRRRDPGGGLQALLESGETWKVE